ncbi:MAG: ABC transporter family substrate-binding protein [Actinomycetota bacterium]|nr:ABC transporter family substrate-binding protein [Actinomycetota bacterium]
MIGVDDLVGGFNPHTLADFTPTGIAVAGLVLPSAFRQATDGGWRLDTTLLSSAVVTDTEPFTVTYRIRRDAAWSNGAPIAAEDFGYLAEQMRSRAGVVSPAGYQLIEKVISTDGGKTVRVVFRAPYPGWRTLFRHLLPAHLLKDAPGGWTDALDAGILVSGGPFALTAADPARRELVLSRNDRYWATPATLDRLVLRQLSGTDLVDALRAGGVQAALFSRPDHSTMELLAAAGFTAPAVVAQPAVAHVLLRTGRATLDDERVRTAVAAALDRDALIAAGTTGGPSAALVANAQVLAPSQPGYQPSAPTSGPPVQPAPETTALLLSEAGYVRTPQGWQRDGEPLALTVAAPKDHIPYPTLAAHLAVQLRDAGIQVHVVTPAADELFGERLTSDAAGAVPSGPDGTTPVGSGGPVSSASNGPAPSNAPVDAESPGEEITSDVHPADIVVVPLPAGGDPATELASNHGCPLAPATESEPAPVSGPCDPGLQALIESAVTGANPIEPVLRTIEPVLWNRMISIPLYQHAWVFVAPGVEGARPEPLLEGPLGGAPRWQVRSP